MVTHSHASCRWIRYRRCWYYGEFNQLALIMWTSNMRTLESDWCFWKMSHVRTYHGWPWWVAWVRQPVHCTLHDTVNWCVGGGTAEDEGKRSLSRMEVGGSMVAV